MATDVGAMPNGYTHHQGYAGMDQNSYAYAANTAASQTPAPPTSSTPSNAPPTQQPQSEISKDEVGWYFVEQYYTTLSRSPEKLYLFYNKRSQFVSGQETDKVPVCVGQRAINDKIRDLEFQDCKVRVTNVDSQSSDSNIVIQVIGEISNKGQPHKKFTQTFVLATQTNGYFVLNDIFRYLVDEEEEPEAETARPAEEVQQVPGTESEEPAATEAEPKTLTSSADPTAVEHDAQQVDKVLEEKVVNNHAEKAPAVAVNGDSTEEEPAAVEETPAPAATVSTTENERPSTTESEVVQPEKPKDPEPTPVTSPPKQAAPEPAPAPKPAAPAAPKTWANLAAAANRVATPAAPQPAAAAPSRPAAKPAPATPTAPAAASSSPAPAIPSAPAAQRNEAPASDSQDEWTSVGGSHNRQQSRQANQTQPDQPQHRGYIKNVHENVDSDDLKAELEKFGELAYFDIARQKNCAFVDFKTVEGYNSALNAPFELNGEKMFVEERRIRPGSTPYIPRGQFQGGRGGRGGAGGQGPPRGNFQGGRGGNAPQRGRGNFAPQRGGRGGAQA